jgi:phage terminase large subunit-like protein
MTERLTLADAVTPALADAARFLVVAWPDHGDPDAMATLESPSEWYRAFVALFRALQATRDVETMRLIGTHMILALTDTVTPPVVRL